MESLSLCFLLELVVKNLLVLLSQLRLCSKMAQFFLKLAFQRCITSCNVGSKLSKPFSGLWKDCWLQLVSIMF